MKLKGVGPRKLKIKIYLITKEEKKIINQLIKKELLKMMKIKNLNTI